ncbi:hypothetical protein LCGC14_1541570 [marine sediment metagenome]|uniref:Uncharacterized protein n=1 Tax=marine sediment metagenome TaxID=412755 RepID=A0A0F9JDV5_9ZZZZ
MTNRMKYLIRIELRDHVDTEFVWSSQLHQQLWGLTLLQLLEHPRRPVWVVRWALADWWTR